MKITCFTGDVGGGKTYRLAKEAIDFAVKHPSSSIAFYTRFNIDNIVEEMQKQLPDITYNVSNRYVEFSDIKSIIFIYDHRFNKQIIKLQRFHLVCFDGFIVIPPEDLLLRFADRLHPGCQDIFITQYSGIEIKQVEC